MKSFILICLAILFYTKAASQSSIEGKIVDKRNGQPIADVNMRLLKTSMHAVSDALGNFVLDHLAAGNYSLSFSCMGYRDTITFVQLTENQALKINVELNPDYQKIKEILVRINRSPKVLEDLPARIDVLDAAEVASYPASNVDNFLQAIPNVYVNRSSGIFSKNSSLTMRGLDGTARVLVLLDGVPLNFSAGGGINWHLLESGEIERIEILKGPASALYGNNAMGGVINLVTKRPSEPFNADVSIYGGTYNTFGGELNFGNNFTKEGKGFYWSNNSFYRQGDGYIIVPESDRDSNDVPLKIKEFCTSLKTGYKFDNEQFIEAEYRFYTDKRNDGIQIYEPDGSYLKYTTSQFRLSYNGKIGGMQLFTNAFYHKQDYGEFSERLNETGDSYKLYFRNQTSAEYGVWINMLKKWSQSNEFSFGIDLKSGDFYAEDIYFTSTDFFERGGNINFFALFAQDEIRLLDQKLLISIGLRADFAQFRNGYLNVEDPTPVTAFDGQLSETFSETGWKNLSPKLALKYRFSPWVLAYASISTGFMPPKIDDMVSSRKVNTGFKIANPYLKPETLTNVEFGLDLNPIEKMVLTVSAYYSLGTDFQYFVGTGDTVDVDRPVVKRENISKVRIYGLESSLSYQIIDNLIFKANYTYNHSAISEFDLSQYTGIDLSGKLIAETPPHQAYAGATFTNRIMDLNLGMNYIGEMWQDEQNTVRLDPYSTFDLRMSKKLKHFTISLDIQNVFNKEIIDKKGGIAPGRFMLARVGYRIARYMQRKTE